MQLCFIKILTIKKVTLMFPDSAVASKFTCGEVQLCVSIRSGESYNAITKSKQMDIFVRY